MSRILCLAPSGFGKTTGVGKINIPEKGINFEGLSTDNSYILSVTTKPLPYENSSNIWPITTLNKIKEGRRIITKTPTDVVNTLVVLLAAPIRNIVLDDFNYLMQDWYMANALRTGWDAPKTIGYNMGKVFDMIEKFEGTSKNIIVLAHGEEQKKPDGRIYLKLKTTGKMVDEYVTPEGKFDVTLVGESRYDTGLKRVVKEYITNENEFYSSPKSPLGMFKDLTITNDLGFIVKTVDKYYGYIDKNKP